MADSSSSEYELAPPPTGGPTPGRPRSPIEGRGPVPPPPPRQPPKPLPRLSYKAPTPPEAESEAEGPSRPDEPATHAPRPSRRDRNAERRARRRAGAAADDEQEGTLVAPTPMLDTVEGRGRARLVLGLMALASVALAVAMVARAVGGRGDDTSSYYVLDATQMFPPPMATPPASDAELEEPARNLIARARAALTIDLARSQLQRVVDTYPSTQAAADAREALDRLARGLPPFADVPSLAPHGFVSAPDLAPTPPADPLGNRPTPTPPRPQPEPQPEPELVVRVLPEGFSPAPDATEDASGWPTRIVGDRDGMTMVLVPGGVFVIGRDGGTPAEGPAHRVELPPFYLDEHEVTVDQFARYREAMARRGETVLPRPEELSRLGLTGRHPVVMVSAREALRYAEWAGKALPTEAQWEAAARGPDALRYPWGDGPAPWSGRRANRAIDPVMSHPDDRSPFGLFDLAANAWEWTADWFDSAAYGPRARLLVRNPAGPEAPPSQPPRQTVRGSSPTHLTTHREGMRLDTRLPYLGFRCALNVEGLPMPGLPISPASPPAIASPTPSPASPQPLSPPQPPSPRPGPPAGDSVLVPF